MKICAVQAHSLSGDIEHNSERHCRLVESAAGRGADVIVFPELSLTGYEPTMAAGLTLDRRDPRLAPLQQLAELDGEHEGILIFDSISRRVEVARI